MSGFPSETQRPSPYRLHAAVIWCDYVHDALKHSWSRSISACKWPVILYPPYKHCYMLLPIKMSLHFKPKFCHFASIEIQCAWDITVYVWLYQMESNKNHNTHLATVIDQHRVRTESKNSKSSYKFPPGLGPECLWVLEGQQCRWNRIPELMTPDGTEPHTFRRQCPCCRYAQGLEVM